MLATFRKNLTHQRRRIAFKLQDPRLKRITFHTLKHLCRTMECHKTKKILHVQNKLGHQDLKSEKPMTVQNFDRILKRLDPDMRSCLFRYGGSEKYLELGYTPYELKEIGDWSSSKMPEVYAERKGITVAQRRWSEDVR